MRLRGQAIGLLGPGERFEVLAFAESRKKVIEQFGAKFVNGPCVSDISTAAACTWGRQSTCSLGMPHVL